MSSAEKKSKFIYVRGAPEASKLELNLLDSVQFRRVCFSLIHINSFIWKYHLGYNYSERKNKIQGGKYCPTHLFNADICLLV